MVSSALEADAVTTRPTRRWLGANPESPALKGDTLPTWPLRHSCQYQQDQSWNSFHNRVWLLRFVGCLTSQQHASLSQGLIFSHNSVCCHTEKEVPDQTCYLTQLQHTDTRQTSPRADPMRPGAWQVATGVPIFQSLVWLIPDKNPMGKVGTKRSAALEVDILPLG